ncbi:MAG TPA: nodulation protein NfeD [Casimicrobiaceae bacterium]
MVMRFLLILSLACVAFAANAAPVVVKLDVTGVIGPASAEYVERGLVRAERDKAELVLLRLDTPGGLDTSMRSIVRAILASPIPVVGYVAPSGARAASAGTFILYACHVAAMAPGTNLGAASPVSIGFTPGTPSGGKDGDATKDKDGKALPADVHERKAMQDAAAYIRSLAQLRGRNAEWAEKAVTEAASLSATEAKAQNVVELIATDDADLLRQLDGRKVKVANGERTLATASATIQSYEPDWHFRALSIIADPTVATILMLLGIYGLIFEFGHPGFVFPGVLGAVSLLLGLYALHLLPVNYAGLALMALGIAFMIGEAFVPAFGSLGLGGVAAFVIGAMMLIDTDVPGFGTPLSLVIVLALVSVGFVVTVVRMAVRARNRPLVTGLRSMVGANGEMLEDATDTGWANIDGVTWRVRVEAPLAKGHRIRVVGMNGNVPIVEQGEEG